APVASGVSIDSSNNVSGVGTFASGALTINAASGNALSANTAGASVSDSRALVANNPKVGNYCTVSMVFQTSSLDRGKFDFQQDGGNSGGSLFLNMSDNAGVMQLTCCVFGPTQYWGFGNVNPPTAPVDIGGDTLRVRQPRTPASSSAAGNKGDFCWDGSFL